MYETPAETGQRGDVLEQLSEEKQPDHRLDELHHDVERLAPECTQIADGHVRRLHDQRAHRESPACVALKLRPVWLR